MSYEITKEELTLLDIEFRIQASRLLNMKYGQEINSIKRFLHFIENNELIIGFVNQNNNIRYDMEEIIKSKEWRTLYDIPIEKEHEIAWVYQFLKYCEANVKDLSYISSDYSNSRKFKDNINAFCNMVINPFINYISSFLLEVKINMGYDKSENVKIEVKNESGQVNVAMQGSSIAATNTVNISQNDIDKINNLDTHIIELLKKEDIDEEVKEDMVDDIVMITEQINSPQPSTNRIKKAITGLKTGEKVLSSVSVIATLLNTLYTLVEPLIK